MTQKARVVSRKPEGFKKPGAAVIAKRGVAKKSARPPMNQSIPTMTGRASAGRGYAVELPSGPRGQVAMLAIREVLGRVAKVPQRKAERILADVRGAAAPEARVMDWLRLEDRDRPDAESALEAAFRRGDQRKADILRDPTMLTGEAAAERLGVSRETINKRAQQGKLLALEFGKRGKRYPAWQFEDSIAGAPLERALAALGPLGAWEQYRFFTQAEPVLGGRTPVEALRKGALDAVLGVAAAWSEGEQGAA